ncbi:MAG: ACT domain-containing protein [Gammaproteobacteria bacterium]|nr:ACT domain-containing protein [Gammaproteobacteria bacterium]NIR97798.1 ACT domain-containing protein [Gammaproteobacteria bacterium]NIT63498.1 ACT domain-containing protein [Gammaproteobacteria bacterium]NIV20445.1 ACT domain-containing protein [Gammaproteobacteria bacterium]NIX11027.1 ACT domain-containing protein [Gammaproteobacteria bacterium]
MDKWYMLTVVGSDRPGIVARLTHALFEGGANLGEASMMRLGGNFTIMLMVEYAGTAHRLDELVEPVLQSLGLRWHVDRIEGRLHQHRLPDVRIRVSGADRAGIVARVTGALAEAGLNILELESDVGGSAERPIYVMHIEGHAVEGVEVLRSALAAVSDEGMDVSLEPIDTMIG